MDVNFLFWNLNKNTSTLNVLPSLLEEHNVQIAITCEFPDVLSNQQKLRAFAKDSLPILSNFKVPTKNISPRIKILTSYEQNKINIIKEGYYYSFFILEIPYTEPILIVAVHMVSKLHEKDPSVDFYNLSQTIRKTEKEISHDRTIVIGDFNQNPFEEGMTSAGGLHAVMDKDIASTGNGGRVVRKIRYPFFYNPMWGFLGDNCDGHPGTYFYRKSENMCLFWNIFDQVLIRPSLFSIFKNDSLDILTTAGKNSLIKNNKRPDKETYSDHLPIKFSLSFDDNLIDSRVKEKRQEFEEIKKELKDLQDERVQIDV